MHRDVVDAVTYPFVIPRSKYHKPISQVYHLIPSQITKSLRGKDPVSDLKWCKLVP